MRDCVAKIYEKWKIMFEINLKGKNIFKKYENKIKNSVLTKNSFLINFQL